MYRQHVFRTLPKSVLGMRSYLLDGSCLNFDGLQILERAKLIQNKLNFAICRCSPQIT